MKLPSAMMALLVVAAPLFAAEKQQSAAPAVAAPADTGLPAATPPDRYKAMMGKGLFSPATPPPPPTDDQPKEQTPSFAQNLYIMGISSVGGKDYVYVQARDQQRGFSLMEGESTPDGVTLVHVDRSPEIGKSKATLKKNTEFGTIGFDEAVMQAPPTAQAAPPPPQQFPGAMRGAGAITRMPNMPGGPGTVPRPRRIVLPQNNPTTPNSLPGTTPNVIRRPRTIGRPLR